MMQTNSQHLIFGKITKPLLVSFLRICDRDRLTVRRIRYASIRSKGSLISDIMEQFTAEQDGSLIKILSKNKKINFPALAYCTEERLFFRDGVPFDSEKTSRELPKFDIVYQTTVLNFGPLYGTGLDTGTVSGLCQMFP